MKLESMELFTVVYSEMLQKISAVLENRDDLCPRDIDNALNYAMKHIYIIPECLGFDPEDYSITLIRNNDGRYQFHVDFDKEAVAAIKFTDEKYRKMIARSFVLVAQDDELSKLLGLNKYISIIEEAHGLVFKGLLRMEGVDASSATEMLDDIGELLVSLMENQLTTQKIYDMIRVDKKCLPFILLQKIRGFIAICNTFAIDEENKITRMELLFFVGK